MTITQTNTRSTADRSISSQDLFAGQKWIIIQHGQHEYQLRITKENKLILTK